MAEAAANALRARLRGITYEPDDGEYQASTAPLNSSYEQRPAVVVRPADAADVVGAVAVVGEAGGRVFAQSTGHGASGPVGPSEVLIDMSALNAVSVDPATGIARVGAGATWHRVQTAAAPHHLLGLSGTSPSVGVAGYTFSGGVGWFIRKHGLASGALRSVEYVDGTGALRRASDNAAESVDREALWAFRGAAPVGIATSIDIQLAAVPELWTGYLLWPAEELEAIAAAWFAATRVVDSAVTSGLSLLHLPPKGPFPDHLLGTNVVHLSYVSPEGGDHLEPMRDAVRKTAAPAVDTTGPGDVASLTSIHLDPPSAVPASGRGRWLNHHAADVIVEMFDAARIGRPGGLNMIELRHTDSAAVGSEGAMTAVPAPFLLHAVGAAADDDARRSIETVLESVQSAGRIADIGRSAPAFCEGHAAPADALTLAELDRLHSVRAALDPAGVLTFHRYPDSEPR